jgi:hypothetical protein
MCSNYCTVLLWVLRKIKSYSQFIPILAKLRNPLAFICKITRRQQFYFLLINTMGTSLTSKTHYLLVLECKNLCSFNRPFFPMIVPRNFGFRSRHNFIASIAASSTSSGKWITWFGLVIAKTFCGMPWQSANGVFPYTIWYKMPVKRKNVRDRCLQTC